MPKFLQSLRGAKRRNLFKILNSLSRPTERCSLSPVPFPLPFGQAGQSTVYIIIIIIVILFAVMFAGGGASLFTGNEPSSVTNAPTPTSTTGDTSSTSPSTNPSPTITPKWSVSYIFPGCTVGGIPLAEIISTGTENGYISLEISNGAGVFNQIATAEFLQPASVNKIVLLNSVGFNTHDWKVDLYSGGVNVGGLWTGGIFKARYSGVKTGC